MGYIHKINKDKKSRYYFNKKELNLVFNKYTISCKDISRKHKLYFWSKFIYRYHLNSSSSRIVNTCVITGRSHWILRRFRCSRMTFKTLADKGLLRGVRRASF